jgi:hypothetical protein
MYDMYPHHTSRIYVSNVCTYEYVILKYRPLATDDTSDYVMNFKTKCTVPAGPHPTPHTHTHSLSLSHTHTRSLSLTHTHNDIQTRRIGRVDTYREEKERKRERSSQTLLQCHAATTRLRPHRLAIRRPMRVMMTMMIFFGFEPSGFNFNDCCIAWRRNKNNNNTLDCRGDPSSFGLTIVKLCGINC